VKEGECEALHKKLSTTSNLQLFSASESLTKNDFNACDSMPAILCIRIRILKFRRFIVEIMEFYVVPQAVSQTKRFLMCTFCLLCFFPSHAVQMPSSQPTLPQQHTKKRCNTCGTRLRRRSHSSTRSSRRHLHTWQTLTLRALLRFAPCLPRWRQGTFASLDL
jgi:hypothetical protein